MMKKIVRVTGDLEGPEVKEMRSQLGVGVVQGIFVKDNFGPGLNHTISVDFDGQILEVPSIACLVIGDFTSP